MLAKKINVGRGGLKNLSYIYPVIKKRKTTQKQHTNGNPNPKNQSRIARGNPKHQ